MKSKKIYLLLIVAAAFLLRFYKLGSNPPGMFFDEMALGYNAYSISQTAKDEHGVFLPLVYFASFGDYKPPGYIYAAVPLVRLFGLSEFTTRFPSAFFGSLTVLLVYFLVIEIFADKKEREKLGLLSALFLALSPWHVFLSRVAYEANLTSFLTVLSVLLFLKSFKTKFLLVLSALFAGLSMYTFNSARFGIPLIFMGFGLYFLKDVLKNKKGLLLSLIIGSIFVMGLIPHLTSREGKIRYNEVNIFSDLEIVKDSNRRIEEDGGNVFAKIIHNRRAGYVLLFLKHYFDNLDLRFLFLTGDVNPRLHNQETGQLYLLELPFLFLGVFFLFKKAKKKSLFIVFYWLLVGLVPASVARETPHALRSELVLPTFQIMIAVGFYYSFLLLKSKWIKGIIATAYLFSFVYFIHNYFYHYPKQFASFWYSGLKEAANYAYIQEEKYQTIIFPDLGRSYISFLFYNSYDPGRFQSASKVYPQSEVLSGDLLVAKQFDKFYFYLPDQLEGLDKPVLLIQPKEASSFNKLEILKEFKDFNGKTIYMAGEVK